MKICTLQHTGTNFLKYVKHVNGNLKKCKCNQTKNQSVSTFPCSTAIIKKQYEIQTNNKPNAPHLRNGFLICRFVLRSGSVQDFQEVRRLGPHPTVNVCFGTLYVIVQVMSKHMYQVDGVISCATRNVSRKQYECHITDIVVNLGIRILQLHRRFSVTKEDERGSV